MAEKKSRLELTWIGKEDRPRPEPRILLENEEYSYHARLRVGENDIFDNMLIKGDNLLALRALETGFLGKVRCIYIDPPYNTGSAFEHYDDGLEHSLWLTLMRARLESLHRLLDDKGTIWISIDDAEMHYLKVLCDEVFGRANHIATIVAAMNPKGRQLDQYFAGVHEYLLCFAKDISQCALKPESSEEVNESDFPLVDEQGRYRLLPLRNTNKKFNPKTRPNLHYPLFCDPTTGAVQVGEGPDLSSVAPQFGDGTPAVWRWGKEKATRQADELHAKFVNRRGAKTLDVFQKDRLGKDRTKKLQSLWLAEAVGSTDEAKREAKAFVPDDVFATPKPERLLRRIIEISTRPGDLVLDSFAGSGTSGAVAHKMGRRWIMVELGEQCHTHVVPRLRAVIDGADVGGVTKETGWVGGGGFRFFNLAPSLLEKDKWGNWIVSKVYRPEMLAEAMCKLEGFHYEPAPDVFWIHGKSTETDFVYVTTQNLSRQQLQFISDQVGNERTLLICCAAFRAERNEFPNLTVKKIPQTVLSRCEWGRDDYSFNVAALPSAQIEEVPDDHIETTDGQKGRKKAFARRSTGTAKRRMKAAAMQSLPLFASVSMDDEDDNGGKSK